MTLYRERPAVRVSSLGVTTHHPLTGWGAYSAEKFKKKNSKEQGTEVFTFLAYNMPLLGVAGDVGNVITSSQSGN